MRIRIYTLLAMTTLILTETQAVSKEAKPYGGTLTWGTCHKPTIINPIYTTGSVSMSLLDLIFNRLVRMNSKGGIEPDLTQRWEVSSDGLVYTFYLRKGVKFHNGIECTADDVKFTYDKMAEQENGSPYYEIFQSVEDFKAIDKYTFRIRLKKPSASFIYMLVREIVPKHILEGSDLKNSAFNTHPVGTGPFRFKEWRGDDQITLEYNSDYYEGRPYLDSVIVRTYSDSRGLWSALMRGEVDYATFIEREDYEVVKDDPAFKAYAMPCDYYYAIHYNPDDAVLSDRRVREAIAYGIDRKALIERAAYGYGMECKGPFYPGSLGFNPYVRAYEYNPRESARLLKEAGWNDNNNDGILEKKGEELTLKILVDSRSEIYKRIIMVIRQQLQEVGIKVRALLYENENLLTDEFLNENRPQARLRFFYAGTDADLDLARIGWSDKESERFCKVWDYKRVEVEELFDLGETAYAEEEMRLIYRKIHKLIYEEQPCCFLYFPFVFHAISAKFEDVDEFFTLNMPYYSMKNWYIKERR